MRASLAEMVVIGTMLLPRHARCGTSRCYASNVPAPRRDATVRKEGVTTVIDYGVGFGRYRFDLQDGRLWAGAKEIRLTPKASAVLKVLVTHAGAPVKKEHLFASVWSDPLAGDDALTSCIQELRNALADDARQPQYIETRHRKGYQFIAPLSGDVARAKSVATTHPPAAGQDLAALAVLPFADMSPGRDQDYLCEGFAEELISALTQIEGLRVASRAASFQFRGAGADVREVGRALRVGTLLEGSVRKANNHLRVTVQLVEVSTGALRWSQHFDRTLDEVFAIQREIAASVATSLRGGALGPREQQALARPQTAAVAYEYYLRGQQCRPRMTAAELRKGAEMFDRAVALDADYAPAHVGLAMAHAALHEWFGARDEDRVRAERASGRALELAPALAEAHVARACALSLARRYDEAGQAFEEAVRLDANSFDAYYYYARTAFAQGEIERSADLFKKAAAVRQDDFQSPMLQAQSLEMLGRTEEAAKATREGIRRAERILVLNPTDGRALSLGSVALYSDGQHARALAWSDRSLELYHTDPGTLMNAACLQAKMGNREKALDLLERVFARGYGKRDWVEHDPDYEILRDDPRFTVLLERLK
jgi:adenylate cyclase